MTLLLKRTTQPVLMQHEMVSVKERGFSTRGGGCNTDLRYGNDSRTRETEPWQNKLGKCRQYRNRPPNAPRNRSRESQPEKERKPIVAQSPPRSHAGGKEVNA